MKTYTVSMNVSDLLNVGVHCPLEFDNGIRYILLPCSEFPWEDHGTMSLTWITCGLGDKILLEMWCIENHIDYTIIL